MKTAKANKPNKSIEYYLSLKYPVTLYPDPDGGYVVEIVDLPGCLTQAETAEEALENIEEARELWIETAYEYGDRIPLPQVNYKNAESLSSNVSQPPEIEYWDDLALVCS